MPREQGIELVKRVRRHAYLMCGSRIHCDLVLFKTMVVDRPLPEHEPTLGDLLARLYDRLPRQSETEVDGGVAALQLLPFYVRGAVVLHAIDGLDCEMAARILRIPAAAVPGLVHEGRMELRRRK